MICTKCNNVNEKTLLAYERGSLCHICYPVNNISRGEIEIAEWIQSIYSGDIQRNVRNVIAPKELDIYIPNKNFAIEHNGLYWHSEERLGANYHVDKMNECREKNIHLFQIFSDEWEERSDILKSMIAYRLGLCSRRVHARNCDVVDVNSKQEKEFFDRCHIAGYVTSKKCIGLRERNTGELVAAISVRSPFVKKHKGKLEIARFASELNLHVSGGFSKMIKHIVSYALDNNYQSIMTYADLRFGEGNTYGNCGMKEIGNTVVDYHYTNGYERFNRFRFRAQQGMSEKEFAEHSGVWKIYGCGSRLYELKLLK
jgi:hypothetical protein